MGYMQFSIIVPTYNRSDLLTETIDSVLNQTFLELNNSTLRYFIYHAKHQRK